MPHVPPMASQLSSPASRPLRRNSCQYMQGRSSRMQDMRFAQGGDVTTRSKGAAIIVDKARASWR